MGQKLSALVLALQRQGTPRAPAQPRNLPFDYTGHDRQVFGRYFEHLAWRIFGGRFVPSSTSSGADIINERTRMRYDSKAVQMGHSATLIASQLQGAEAFLTQRPDWGFDYVFFRHGVEASQDARPIREKLACAAHHPLYALVVPVPLLRRIIDARDRIGGSNYFHAGTRKAAYSLDSSLIHDLAMHPDRLAASLELPLYTAIENVRALRLVGYNRSSFPLVTVALASASRSTRGPLVRRG